MKLGKKDVKLEYDISSVQGEENRRFFGEMLPYVSEHILSFSIKEGKVEVEYGSELYAGEIRAKLDILRDFASRTLMDAGESLAAKVLLDRRDVRTRNSIPIFEELKERGELREIGPGTFAYAGLMLNLLRYFHLKTWELGADIGAVEVEFPVLFPLEQFQRGGYFETFPHHIMFQSTIRNDIEVLERFTRGGVDASLLKEMKQAHNVLRNAACGPIYPMLANSEIDTAAPRIFFVIGKCFRNEATHVFELARMNEFTMSELVFIGTDAQVREGIQQVQERLWNFWIETFELNCSIETANDSFFGGSHNKLRLFQLLGDAKQELRLLLPQHEQSIACSSANFHRTHFTKKYGIRNQDGFCHTGCIAFGIERLAYAFLSQHGCDPTQWPSRIAEEIYAYKDLPRERNRPQAHEEA